MSAPLRLSRLLLVARGRFGLPALSRHSHIPVRRICNLLVGSNHAIDKQKNRLKAGFFCLWSGREGENKPFVLNGQTQLFERQRPGIRTPTYKNTCQGQVLYLWSGREDLNLRPPQPHCGALPGCATPREPG